MDLDIDLLSLRVFLTVCEEGSFAKAARKLFLSEPTVSVRVRILEEQVGFTLFVRGRGGAEPTYAGTLFRETAARTLQDLREAVDEVRATARRISSRITFWCNPVTLSYLLPEILPRFTEAHPDIELVPASGRPTPVVSELLSGHFDFVMITELDRPALKGYESTACFRDLVGLALASEHPLAERPCLAVDDLIGQRLLSNGRSDAYWPLIREALARRDIRLHEVFGVESLEARRMLARQQFGVSFFTLVSILDEVVKGELVFRPLLRAPGHPIELTTWFCCSNGHKLHREIQELQDIILATSGKLQTRLEAAGSTDTGILLSALESSHTR